MHKTDIKKIDELLKAEKWQEAKAEIASFLQADLSPREKAEILLALARIYLRISSSAARQYDDRLKKGIAALKQINKHEKDSAAKIELKAVREQISGK